MSSVAESNTFRSVIEIESEDIPKRPTTCLVNFMSSLPKSFNRDLATRCGSTGGSASDEDPDDEIINVTDDDVVDATTDSDSSTNMFKVSHIYQRPIFFAIGYLSFVEAIFPYSKQHYCSFSFNLLNKIYIQLQQLDSSTKTIIFLAAARKMQFSFSSKKLSKK